MVGLNKSGHKLNSNRLKPMRIRDSIVIYNETFRYIAKTYGRARINDPWAAISKE